MKPPGLSEFWPSRSVRLETMWSYYAREGNWREGKRVKRPLTILREFSEMVGYCHACVNSSATAFRCSARKYRITAADRPTRQGARSIAILASSL